MRNLALTLLFAFFLFQKTAVAVDKIYTEIEASFFSFSDYTMTTDSQITKPIVNGGGFNFFIGKSNIELRVGNDDMTSGSFEGFPGTQTISVNGVDNWLITVATASNQGIFGKSGSLYIANSSNGKINLISGVIGHNTSDNFTIYFSNSNASISTAANTIIYNSNVSLPSLGFSAIRSDKSDISVNNSGTIYGVDTFYFTSGSHLNLENNITGNIYNISATTATSLPSSTINLMDSSSATIVNSGTISSLGSLSSNTVINTNSGKLDLTNEAGGTINGKIILGSNANSSITLNGGTINGDIKIGNNSQNINLNGGSLNGAIDGESTRAGIVNIRKTFVLSSSSKLGATNGVDTINVNEGANFTANGYANASAINISSGALMNLESDNIIATNTNVRGTLNFGDSDRILNSNLTILENGAINLNSSSHNVSNSLTLNSGSVINSSFSTSGILGKITSTGAANINSNVKLNININKINDTITNGSSYSLVSGSGSSSINVVDDKNISVNGSNSNSINNLKSTLIFSTNSTDNELLLKVARVETTVESLANTSANAANIYQNIISLNSLSGSLLSFSESQFSESVTQRLKSAMPQSDDGIRQTSLNILNSSAKSIENRLDTKRSLAFKKKSKNSTKYVLSKDGEIWGQFFTNNANQNNLNKNDGDGYKSNSFGMIFGLEEKISKNTIIGAAFNYSNSNIKSSDNSKKTDLKAYQVSLYSDHKFGKFFIDNILAFSFNEYESSREMSSLALTANSNYNGKSYFGKIRGGFVNKISDNLSFIPESSLTFSNNSVEDYTEKNADTMNLNVRYGSTNFLEGRIGLNLNYNLETEAKSIINCQLKSSFGYDFLGKENKINSNFIGQSLSFVTKTTKYDPKSFRIGSSLNFLKSSSTEFSLEYGLELKSKYKSNLGLLKMAHKF